MGKDIFVKGNLHIYDFSLDLFNPEGVIIHVEKDVFIHRKEDDFTYPETDTFIENIFAKQDVKDIIAYSTKNEES